MKKLTFEKVKSEFEILPKEEMKKITAGDGIITSGTGTQNDPYVISSTVYLNSVTFTNSNSNAITSAINDYNDLGATEVNGHYYKFDITVKDMGSGSIPVEHTYSTQNGSVTYYDSEITQAGGTPGGGMEFGNEDPTNNSTGFYYQNMSGFLGSSGGGYSQADLVQMTVRHELGHTFGLEDTDSVSLMQDFSEHSGVLDSGSGPGQIDSTAIEYMLSGGKVYWGSGVTMPH